MKNVYRSIGLIGLASLIGSCGGDGPVAPPPPTTASVTMSATTGTLVPGANVQLSATARDQSGNALARTLAWTTSDAAKATVSSTGMVSGAAPGSVTITAAVDGKSATSAITVLDGGVVTNAGGSLTLLSGAVQIDVPSGALPSATNISAVGSTAYANDPRVVKETPVDFGPTGTQFAKPVSVKIKYAVTNLPQGTEEAALQLYLSTTTGWQAVEGSLVDVSAKTVAADVSHFSVYAILTPLPVAAVTIHSPPNKPPLVVGDTAQLTATLTDAQGGTLTNRAVTWATTNAAIATVTSSGLVTGVAPGTATVSATAGGVVSNLPITVTPVPIAGVAVTLLPQAVEVGQTSQATAVMTDAGGNILTGRVVSWSSDNSAVATVSASGEVTAIAPGTAQITATSEGRTGSAAITVSAVPVASVTVTPPSASVTAGATQQLAADAKDAHGNILTGRPVAWSSSNPAVATVSQTGVVTAVLVGTATITATSEGKNGTASITVTPIPVAALTLSGSTTPVVLGQTQQLTATPKDGSGNTLADRTVNWVSSNTAVLTVNAASTVSNSTGATVIVTATGLGTAIITASSESAPSAATPVITVNPVPVATVIVNPASPTLVLGQTPTQQLTATLKDVNNTVLTGRTVTWSSSNPAAATVDANGFVTAVAVGNTTITATSEGKAGTSSITVSLAPVASVSVSLAQSSITAVGTSQATATTLDSNGNMLAGRAVTWSSDNAAIATVSAQGVVSGVAVGTANIIATSEGKTGSAAITITPALVATITLNPPSITVVSGVTQQLTATLEDIHHNVLTGRTIDWSSDAPGVATVSASGLVTAVAPGVATIAVVSETKVATSLVTVTPFPVASVSVSLASGSVIAGQTTQATATTLDAGGNALTGRAIAWTSDNLSVATVSSSGLVTSVAPGIAHIIATSETKSGQATLAVVPVPVATVTVSPLTASIAVGSTQQLTATTKDGNGATLSGRTVTWASTDVTIASVDLNGLVTAHALGSATISATSEGKSGSSSIAVTPVPVASVTVTLTLNSITAVGTSQAAAATLDANGAPLAGRAITWSSSNALVAIVSAQGVVSGVAEGTANIVATSEGKSGFATLTVTQAPVATVTVNPPSATVFQGASEQLTVVLEDAHHNVLTRPVTWSSNNTAVATVSTTGLVTAAPATMGTATITATSEGQTGTSLITVSQVPVASVSVALSPSTINVGQTSQATATLLDAANQVLTGRVITWTSDNTSVATVSSSGVVTALSAGTAHISGASGGQTGSATLTVTPIPVASVGVTLGASPIQIGQTTQATATTRDAGNNVLTGRAIAWSSDNTAVATVSVAGLVTAISAGTANIVATSEGKNGAASLTVVPVPVASLTLSAPVTPVVLGQTQQLSALPKDGSGNILTGRTVSWVSSNPAILSVSSPSSVSSSSGATIGITAAGVGTASITASSESAPSASTPAITVNPIPVATVTVTPPSATLALGVNSTQQLTATLKDANANVLTGRIVTWTSSNPFAATVDANGLVTAVGGGSTTISATSEGQAGTASITVTVPVWTVTVNPSSATLTVGLTHQLTATTKDVNGSVLAGRVVTWSSSDPTLATVSSTGLVTAVASGIAVITATSEGKSGTSSITVTPIPVASVSVSLSGSTIQVGQTTQATATTYDSNNTVLTGRVVTWSTGNAAIATVSPTGLVTATGVGSTAIIATSEGKTGNATINVVAVPVASVTVSPGTASIIAGATQQLSAETKDANNIVLSGRVVTWSSNNTAVTTVDGSGLVTAVSVGGATITATSEGKTGTSSITVLPVPVASVNVLLSPNSITAVGTSQATATTLDSHGGVLTGRVVTWSSGNTAIATVSAQGVVTPVAVGTVSIIAASEGQSGSATLTVTQAPVASVTVSPSSATVVQGSTEQLSATLKDAHGNILSRPVTWSSSSDAIASVSQSGLVTANAVGGATITATSEGQSGTASVTVSAVPVASVTVTLSSGTITDAQTTQATAIVRDADGNVLVGRTITWTSDNSAVATVSPTGLVTPVAAGSAQIRASIGGQTGTAALTVIPRVAAVIVTPSSANIVIGSTHQLAAETRDANNNVLTGRSVTWSSDAPSIASVSADGLVTSNALGSATITATSEGVTGTSAISVVQVPVNLVTVSLGSTTITVGQTTQATATTYAANNNILTGRSITWSSGNTAVATVSPAGLVTAVGAGSVQIIAMSEGKTASTTLTVIPAPVATVTVGLAPGSITAVGTSQATATTLDANNNVLTGRVVTWTSSNEAVATVDAQGLVTAVAVGTSNILATSEGKTGSATLTVTQAPVATVTISAPATLMVVGGIQQLTATTKDSHGNVLTGHTITWVSSNTAVLTVSSSGNPATVTAVGVGTATITATSESVSSSPTPTITVNPIPVASVTVSLNATSITAVGTTQATATTLDANGNPLTGRAVSWSSSNTAAATVDPQGVVTAVAVGTSSITATSEGRSGSATITVTAAPVATVTVSLVANSINAVQTTQATATLLDAKGRSLTGRTIIWSSDNTPVATVDQTTGLVTAVSLGAANIIATSEGIAGNAALTVTAAPVATVAVNPPTANLVIGIIPTQQLGAVLSDANGHTLSGRLVTWASSNGAAATVDANGLVTAVGAGTSTITATSEGKSGNSTITVTQAPVDTVTVTPATVSLVIGITPTQQLTVVTKDANGNVLTGRTIAWVSSNPAAATVNETGLVTAVAAGSTTITATSEGKSGTSSVTVSLAPVASVTVSAPTTPMVIGTTQQLTAVTKDANDHVLTGRVITWASSNSPVLTVSANGSQATVTAVGAGTATITASSESVSSNPTPTITVIPPPVTSVTLSFATTAMVVGGTQTLTAQPRDGTSHILSGRTVNWVSSDPTVLAVSAASSVSSSTGATVTLTAVAAGTATVTATSETAPSATTPSIQVRPTLASGPLRVSTVNPRYFADPTGHVVYLTGSEYWKTIQDNGPSDPPPTFDYSGFLDSLQRHNHNFTRLYMWEQARWSAETSLSHWFSPTPYMRTGPGTAADGGPKFDVSQINPDYLARVRQRVIDAGARGIYVSVMLFNGWSVEDKEGTGGGNPWLAHPFNAANNINGIDGDPNADASGAETQTLAIPEVTALQDAYVKAVIDAVNDLDNVIYEISNESDQTSDTWQYHMIDLIRSYEATKPKQHPIGMTVPYPTVPEGTNNDVLNSSADWVSMNGNADAPAIADGAKVSLWDTDHLCGICGDAAWAWKSFTRGHNPLLMDGYDGSAGVGDPEYIPSDPKWEQIRTNMGYARSYALRMDLAHDTPRGDLVSTGYALAGTDYLVFLPTGGTVNVNLSFMTGTRTVEWFNPATGQMTAGGTVTGGSPVDFTAPFSGMAVLFIHP